MNFMARTVDGVDSVATDEIGAGSGGSGIGSGPGGIAWMSIGIFVVLWAAAGASTFAAVAGAIPLWAGMLLNTGVLYFVAHINHEAVHRNISGRRTELVWLNDAIGHFGSFWLFLPFLKFRAVHFAHHRLTNHRELDCDMWFAQKNPLMVILCCCTLVFGYETRLRRLDKLGLVPKRDMLIINLSRGVAIAIAIGLSIAGFGWEVLALWVLPAAIVTPILGFLFAWLVHHPHDSQEKMTASNVWLVENPILRKIATFFFVFQNYHLVHHVNPRVPFYLYSKRFKEIRPELEAAGAAIKQLA